MNLSELSVKRPVGISMIIFILILLGFISLYHLPIDLMPDITYPTISISSAYENASPVEMETIVTRPIEQALSAVPGVEKISSTSTEGRSTVRVVFAWGTDLDAAANDVRDRIDRVLPRLPDTMSRPTLRKFDITNFPIIILGAASDLDPVQMLKLIEDQVKYRLERIPGVAAIDIGGGRKREIHVNLDIERLKAVNLNPSQVISRLKQENTTRPAGIIESGNLEFIIRTPGEFDSVEQIGETVIKDEGSSIIRLKEVAQIEDRWEKVRQIVRVNCQPGVRITVSKQSGHNTVQVADAVLSEVEKINDEIPQLHISPIVNSSKYIKQAINNVSMSATFGGLLALIILLFFLGSLRSMLIIGTSIPISIITTFTLMYYNNFTLNIMSLGGIALGIGMLVDNAIVVLENIFRHCECGEHRYDAAIKGSSEVFMPIIASTITTLVIFLPLLFVQGMTGMMFKQLSFVVGFALFCSLFVALTIVPMLSSKWLKVTNGSGNDGRSERLTLLKRIIKIFEGIYLRMLDFTLTNRIFSLAASFALLLACLAFIPGIQTELLPSTDEGEVRVTAELETGARLGVVAGKIEALEQVIRNTVPERENIITSVGGGMGGRRGGGVNVCEFRIPLVEKQKRTRSSAAIAAALRSALMKIPGVRIRTREGGGLFIFRMGTGGADKVQIQIRGHNFTIADQLAKKLEALLYSIDGITDVSISRESGAVERLVSIDRKAAADQKLSVTRIADFLETLLSGSDAGNFREEGDEFRILVQAKNAETISIEEILDLTILNSDNKPVALRNVVRIVAEEGPMQVEREDQERIVNVTADPGERPLSLVLDDFKEKVKEIPLPTGFSVNLSGDYEEQQKSYRELGFSFILAIILVYMVLAVQYESVTDPMIVMVTVPLSAIGVILAIILTQSTFNVQSFIGCIMLGGIVVNNSILLVDHINALYRDGGMPLPDALKEAGRDRFRPILMTASTTMLGLLPLALGIGEGGEVQAPLAKVVIGGLLVSSLVSLLIIPAVYSIFESLLRRKHSS